MFEQIFRLLNYSISQFNNFYMVELKYLWVIKIFRAINEMFIFMLQPEYSDDLFVFSSVHEEWRGRKYWPVLPRSIKEASRDVGMKNDGRSVWIRYLRGASRRLPYKYLRYYWACKITGVRVVGTLRGVRGLVNETTKVGPPGEQHRCML